MKLRFLDIMNSRIPAKLGVCADSEELKQWTSSFESRALAYGRWWGSTQLMQFCVTSSSCGSGSSGSLIYNPDEGSPIFNPDAGGYLTNPDVPSSSSSGCSSGAACIVLPRQVAVIEAANLNGAPMNMQGVWGQFVRPHLAWNQCGSSLSNNLPCTDIQGWRCGCGCGCAGGPQMQDEGMVPSFSVTNAGDYIKLYATNIADYGKKVVVQGKDVNGIWVRSTIDGVVQDGEQVVLAAGGVLTTNRWAVGAPYALYKEVTSYKVLMFAVDADGNERQLGDYEPTDTNPSFRKMRIPSLGSCGTGCGTNRTVRAIVSLQSTPITGPNDWLMFDDALPAYSDGILAEKLYENLETTSADSYFFGNPRPARNGRGVLRHAVGQGALGFLESLLRKQTGDRTVVRMQRDGLSLLNFV